MQADLFTDFKPYPSAPGFKRQKTSRDAARAIAPVAGSIRDRVLAEIARRPGTADEIAERLGIDRLSVRLRTSELEALNLIRDTGARRPNASGKQAIVWGVA